MSNITQEQLDEAVLDLTGRPEWATLAKGLQNDIYQAQATALDAPDWDTVCRLRGFAEGLAFVLRLRDTVLGAKEVEEGNNAPL